MEADATRITFSWTIGEGTVQGFRVERHASGGAWETRADVGSGVRQYKDTGLTPGAEFEYRVTSLGPLSNSDPSTSAAFATRTLAGTVNASSRRFSGTVSAAAGTLSFAAVTNGNVVETDRLVNISTRGTTNGDNGNMIAGFAIEGDGPKQVLITARAPFLIPYGSSSALPGPKLTLFRLLNGANTQMHANSSWASEANAADFRRPCSSQQGDRRSNHTASSISSQIRRSNS